MHRSNSSWKSVVWNHYIGSGSRRLNAVPVRPPAAALLLEPTFVCTSLDKVYNNFTARISNPAFPVLFVCFMLHSSPASFWWKALLLYPYGNFIFLSVNSMASRWRLRGTNCTSRAPRLMPVALSWCRRKGFEPTQKIVSDVSGLSSKRFYRRVQNFFIFLWLKACSLLFEREDMQGKHRRKRQEKWWPTGIFNQASLFTSLYSNVSNKL